MLDKPNVLACHICALDLTKSFDRLSHKLLIEKMIRDNFSPFVINFVSNYLSNRTQRVKWNNELSRIVSATSGVPQGSSFGPLLFAYFMSDFACDSFQNCLVVKYADDVTLCGVISNDTSDSTLLKAYSSFVSRSAENKMIINENKSCQLFITKQKSRDLNFSRFMLNNICVKSDIKLLGVIFDDKLN